MNKIRVNKIPPIFFLLSSSYLISLFYIMRKPTIQRFLCRNAASWASARLLFDIVAMSLVLFCFGLLLFFGILYGLAASIFL